MPLADLLPDPANPRRMSETQARDLIGSVERWGVVEPVVFNTRTGQLVGGHMRVEAARVLGMKTFPAVDVDLPEEEQRLLNVALNKISGEWDQEKLQETMRDLVGKVDDLTITGFDEGELAKILLDESDDGLPHGQLEPRGFQIVIECDDEQQQGVLLDRLQAEGLSARPIML